MKQCNKCAWRYYNYINPYCECARRILHDFDMAIEIFSKYKKLDCLHFIPKNTKEITVTIVEGKDNFYELIDRYKQGAKHGERNIR